MRYAALAPSPIKLTFLHLRNVTAPHLFAAAESLEDASLRSSLLASSRGSDMSQDDYSCLECSRLPKQGGHPRLLNSLA